MKWGRQSLVASTKGVGNNDHLVIRERPSLKKKKVISCLLLVRVATGTSIQLQARIVFTQCGCQRNGSLLRVLINYIEINFCCTITFLNFTWSVRETCLEIPMSVLGYQNP